MASLIYILLVDSRSSLHCMAQNAPIPKGAQGDIVSRTNAQLLVSATDAPHAGHAHAHRTPRPFARILTKQYVYVYTINEGIQTNKYK